MSKIILKKSAVAGKQPVVADLEYGELALNYADSKLFFKTADNTIAQIGGTNLSTALQNRYSYVASEGQSNFSAIYIPPYVDVFLNGLRLSPGEDYIATTGTNIVLTPGATISDLVEIVSTTSYTVGLDTALQNRYNYTATALQTSFVANYIPGYVDVYKNGVKLNSLEDFTATNGSQVVLSTGCAVGDLVEIIATTSVAAGNAATATTATNVLGGTASVTTLTTSGAISIGTNASGALASFGASNKLFIQGGATNNGIFTQSGATLSISPTSALNSGIRVGALGDVTILNTTVSSSTTTGALIVNGGTGIAGVLSVGGNLTFSGGGNRITGDFSNATVANRAMFQTSTVNGITSIYAIPNGTATVSGYAAFNSQDVNNASYLNVTANAATTSLDAGKFGTGTYLPMTFLAGGSERVRVDTSGNVGIGTSTPAAKLDVSGSGQTRLRITSTGTSLYPGLEIKSGSAIPFEVSQLSNGDGFIYNGANAIIGFSTNATERMRIDASGNVGIGTSSPTQKLHVTSSGTSDGVIQLGGTASNGYFSQINQNANNLQLIANGDQAFRASLGTNNGTGNITFLTAGLTTGNTERMRIDSSGNVGIGTAAPAAKLDIGLVTPLGGATWSGGTDFIKLTALSGSAWAEPSIAFHETGSNIGAKIGGKNTGNGAMNIIFANRDGSSLTSAITERMRIDTSGNLLVGTTSPLSTGTHSFINTSSGPAPLTLRHASSTAGRYWFAGPDSASNFIVYNNGSIGAYLNYGATSWTASSDERVKDIIEPITDAANKVANLRAVIGKYKTDTVGVRRSFLIAQDVQAVLPEAVNAQNDELGTLGVQYTDVIPLLVAAIKEQQEMIAQQSEIITTLTARVAALESN